MSVQKTFHSYCISKVQKKKKKTFDSTYSLLGKHCVPPLQNTEFTAI